MTIKQAWGLVTTLLTSNSSPAITLSSLASSLTAGRESGSIDLTNEELTDCQVMFKFKLATGGTLANDKAVYLYIAGSIDGTTWPQGNSNTVSGNDAAIVTTGLPIIAIPVDVTAYTTGADRFFTTNMISLASFFGGSLPAKVSFVVRNYSGVPFTAAGTDHGILYRPIYLTSN